MGLREFRVDLHIHTCLSPCADLTMIPSALIKEAKKKNLDGIGICDHNSAENVTVIKKAGEREGLKVFGGIEISSSEEVHILAFFDDDASLLKMQDTVYKNLSGENDASYFGEQLIADENDRFIESNDRLLIGSTGLSVSEIVSITHELDGVSIASHIDRESFSLIGQLGFIPEGLAIDALEVSYRYKQNKNIDIRSFDLPLVTSSDAHYLPDIGRSFTTFFLSELSFAEMLMAFQGVKGRKVTI